jgi:hypothetical protein
VSSTFDPVNTGMKMEKQITESDPDLKSLEIFSISLENRNRALQKILLKLQQNSEIYSGLKNADTLKNTETNSDIHNS